MTVIKNILRRLSLLNILISVSAAFAFICYAFYVSGGTALSDSGGLLVSLTVFSMTTLPGIFCQLLEKLLKKAYKPLKITYCIILCLYMVIFTIFSVIVISDSEKELTFDSRQTVIIVCGCKVNGDRPSKTLALRLDKAYELLSAHDDAICIVTGGQGEDESQTEASVMHDYLVKKGIDEDRIYKEELSRNTVENIENSIIVMKDNGIPENSNIICVSTDLHTSRVAMLARERGLDAQIYSSSSPYAYLYLSSLVREFMSYTKYFLFG